jgi:hypothetical protein
MCKFPAALSSSGGSVKPAVKVPEIEFVSKADLQAPGKNIKGRLS